MQSFKSLSAAARTLVVVCILLVLILVFWAGSAVGYRQADFAFRWDRHYGDMFMGPGSPFGMRPMRGEIFQANGASGTIVAVNLPFIAVQSPNQTEKVLVVGTSTIIRIAHAVGSTTDMRVGAIVTAVGTPDAQGRIIVSFMRVMPFMSASTTPRW